MFFFFFWGVGRDQSPITTSSRVVSAAHNLVSPPTAEINTHLSVTDVSPRHTDSPGNSLVVGLWWIGNDSRPDLDRESGGRLFLIAREHKQEE